MLQSTPAKKGASKKKVDSSFFVGKLDATSSSVEYQHINGGEGQLGGQFQVLLTPKKVSFLFTGSNNQFRNYENPNSYKFFDQLEHGLPFRLIIKREGQLGGQFQGLMTPKKSKDLLNFKKIFFCILR